MILAPTFDYSEVVRCRSCLELAPFKRAPFTVRTVQTIGEGDCNSTCYSRAKILFHDDTSLAPADWQAKMKELHESFGEKISAVLTPEQQAKWKQMKQEMMEKHKEMKGPMDHQ